MSRITEVIYIKESKTIFSVVGGGYLDYSKHKSGDYKKKINITIEESK